MKFGSSMWNSMCSIFLCGKKNKMYISKQYLNDLTYKVLGCAIEVHKHLGPGLLESVYEKCFTRDLGLRGIEESDLGSIGIQRLAIRHRIKIRCSCRRCTLCRIKSAGRTFTDPRCCFTFVHANPTKTKRHSYQFSLYQYF